MLCCILIAYGCICRSETRRQPNRARGESRFTDGLESPSETTETTTFYPPGYRCAVGTLEFCSALPDNGLGLDFTHEAVLQLCADSVMKMHELVRQNERLSPVHILPIYVYTVELPEGEDQIYGAMNKAMRMDDHSALEFWRPLIWQLDQALLQLPKYDGV